MSVVAFGQSTLFNNTWSPEMSKKQFKAEAAFGDNVLIYGGNLSVSDTDSSSAHASAIFELESTSKGALLPRMTTAQRNAITAPASGLMVYNTTTGAYNYYDGSSWQAFGSGGGGESLWTQSGNYVYSLDTIGIGVNEPNYQFEVYGNTRITNAAGSGGFLVDTSSSIFGSPFMGVLSTEVNNFLAVGTFQSGGKWYPLNYVNNDTIEFAGSVTENGYSSQFKNDANGLSKESYVWMHGSHHTLGYISQGVTEGNFDEARITMSADTLSSHLIVTADSVFIAGDLHIRDAFYFTDGGNYETGDFLQIGDLGNARWAKPNFTWDSNGIDSTALNIQSSSGSIYSQSGANYSDVAVRGTNATISSGNGSVRLQVAGTEISADCSCQFVLPRMTAATASAIASPENGGMVYVTDTDATFTSVGFWGYENGAWVKL